MEADAPIEAIATLIADATRSTILWTLADGRALPACDLALHTKVKAPTISFHLGKLIEGGLVKAEKHGRHRYYRLADPAIVGLLEKLATLAPKSQASTFAEGQNGKRLRFARTCYDHLAGQLGVRITEKLVAAGHLEPQELDFHLTESGKAFFRNLGIDLEAARSSRRVFARACLDWSERRHHLAGALGSALLSHLLHQSWIERSEKGRAVLLTAKGRKSLESELGLSLSA